MPSIKAVPKGYHTVTPALCLKGAAEAIEFYQRAFGAEEQARLLGPNGAVVHAEVKIGSSIVIVADAIMSPPTQASCHIYVEDADAWWRRATAAGAQVVMPLQDMFWGDRYGVLLDRWGNRWAIATRRENVSPAEMQALMTEALKQMKAS
jgi:PhnB protein